jgi:hypothetical protein
VKDKKKATKKSAESKTSVLKKIKIAINLYKTNKYTKNAMWITLKCNHALT